MSSYFDGFQFLLWNNIIPKYVGLSASLNSCLSGISIITASLFYVYILKLPIFRHQKLSLLIIGICLIIILILEFVFQPTNIFLSYWDMTKVLIFTTISQIIDSFNDIIQKYLFEFDFMNPFLVLMYEGLF